MGGVRGCGLGGELFALGWDQAGGGVGRYISVNGQPHPPPPHNPDHTRRTPGAPRAGSRAWMAARTWATASTSTRRRRQRWWGASGRGGGQRRCA